MIAQRIFLAAIVAASLGGCDERKGPPQNPNAYLYRESVAGGPPVFVAAFDSKDQMPGNNLGNCQDVADLQAKGPRKGVRWWCDESKIPGADGL